MNSTYNENSSLKKSINKSDIKSKKIKFTLFKKPHHPTLENLGNAFKVKMKEIPKIIKLENSTNKNLKNIKIEFSKDKSLVDRLFEIKNTLKIKKKTFI